MEYSSEHPDFITITCLKWKPLLAEDKCKDIIIESLKFSALVSALVGVRG